MDDFTVADYARIYGVAPGTIRYWISLDGIEGRQNGRHKVYPRADIQAAYDRRHPADNDTLIAA